VENAGIRATHSLELSFTLGPVELVKLMLQALPRILTKTMVGDHSHTPKNDAFESANLELDHLLDK